VRGRRATQSSRCCGRCCWAEPAQALRRKPSPTSSAPPPPPPPPGFQIPQLPTDCLLALYTFVAAAFGQAFATPEDLGGCPAAEEAELWELGAADFAVRAFSCSFVWLCGCVCVVRGWREGGGGGSVRYPTCVSWESGLVHAMLCHVPCPRCPCALCWLLLALCCPSCPPAPLPTPGWQGAAATSLAGLSWEAGPRLGGGEGGGEDGGRQVASSEARLGLTAYAVQHALHQVNRCVGGRTGGLMGGRVDGW
jgi:hypothetical protein